MRVMLYVINFKYEFPVRGADSGGKVARDAEELTAFRSRCPCSALRMMSCLLSDVDV